MKKLAKFVMLIVWLGTWTVFFFLGSLGLMKGDKLPWHAFILSLVLFYGSALLGYLAGKEN